MKHPQTCQICNLLLLGCLLVVFGSCRPESLDIVVEVHVVQWADPSLPEVGATVILEEQRLTNGVINSFFTEIDRSVTPASGVVELQTVRSNVLSLRIRVEQPDCFDEIVELNPEELLTDGTPNAIDVAVMPQCAIHADIHNETSPCPNFDVIYRWTPRNVYGAASDVKFTCETEWQAVSFGETENVVCYITGGTWLLHRRFWSCADSTNLDSIWCPVGEVVNLTLD